MRCVLPGLYGRIFCHGEDDVEKALVTVLELQRMRSMPWHRRINCLGFAVLFLERARGSLVEGESVFELRLARTITDSAVRQPRAFSTSITEHVA